MFSLIMMIGSIYQSTTISSSRPTALYSGFQFVNTYSQQYPEMNNCPSLAPPDSTGYMSIRHDNVGMPYQESPPDITNSEQSPTITMPNYAPNITSNATVTGYSPMVAPGMNSWAHLIPPHAYQTTHNGWPFSANINHQIPWQQFPQGVAY